PDWRRIVRTFRARETVEGNARVCFKFGGSDIDLYLADVRLRHGGATQALPAEQTIEKGNVSLPVSGPDRGLRDLRRFMVDTEKGFIREIVKFLRDDLGVKVPITASQINYHGPEIVAETCDYADVHSYWRHPHFPGRPWDRENWYVKNEPMEPRPGRDALLERATWRLLDRPYTLSEWNIPSPIDYAASVVPFAAVVASLQDWDGVFFFQYHSSNENWFTDKVTGYFSFNGHPAKLALLTAFAPAFRRGDLDPLERIAAGTLKKRLSSSLALAYRIGIDPEAREGATGLDLSGAKGPRLATPDGRVVWDAGDPARAHVTLNAPASRAVWGLVAGGRFELGSLSVEVGRVERDYAAIAVTSLDGRPLDESARMLLAAVGSAENKDMGWNEKRTSVGKAWGAGPAQVNGVPAEITFARWRGRAYALDGRGAREKEVPVEKRADGSTRVAIGPEHRTLWYELVRE
ncbi:MAG: hypothetical protein ACYS9X_28550, partial [Planctomycetota bacterium]